MLAFIGIMIIFSGWFVTFVYGLNKDHFKELVLGLLIVIIGFSVLVYNSRNPKNIRKSILRKEHRVERLREEIIHLEDVLKKRRTKCLTN